MECMCRCRCYARMSNRLRFAICGLEPTEPPTITNDASSRRRDEEITESFSRESAETSCWAGFQHLFPNWRTFSHRGDIPGYFRSALNWCLADRTPLLHMTGRVFQFLVQQYLPPRVAKETLPPWSASRLRQIVRRAVHETKQDAISLSRPSGMANARMAPALLETLPHRCPGHFVRYEWRYPYLDRDLLIFYSEFQRSVLVRPGRRRAMMRTALRRHRSERDS